VCALRAPRSYRSLNRVAQVSQETLWNFFDCLVGTIRRPHTLAFLIEPVDGHMAFPKLPWLINFLGDGQPLARRLLCFIPIPAHLRR